MVKLKVVPLPVMFVIVAVVPLIEKSLIPMFVIFSLNTTWKIIESAFVAYVSGEKRCIDITLGAVIS
jgi:hypothetical protein